jgi:hypothetical protein
MYNMQPYGTVPTIELIRRDLCAHPIGTLIATSVRRLARAVGRSAGQISDHLDRLEADGWIRRLSDHSGTVVEVLRSDQAHDRSFAALESDHGPDRLESGDHGALMPNQSSEPTASGTESDHAADPPLHPPTWMSHDLCQEEESARPRDSDSVAQEPLYQRLMAHPQMRLSLAERIAQNPPGTLAEFERDLALAGELPTIADPFFFTVARWRDGQRVAAQEPRNERRSRRQDAPYRPERPAHAQKHSARRGAADRRDARPTRPYLPPNFGRAPHEIGHAV